MLSQSQSRRRSIFCWSGKGHLIELAPLRSCSASSGCHKFLLMQRGTAESISVSCIASASASPCLCVPVPQCPIVSPCPSVPMSICPAGSSSHHVQCSKAGSADARGFISVIQYRSCSFTQGARQVEQNCSACCPQAVPRALLQDSSSAGAVGFHFSV